MNQKTELMMEYLIDRAEAELCHVFRHRALAACHGVAEHYVTGSRGIDEALKVAVRATASKFRLAEEAA